MTRFIKYAGALAVILALEVTVARSILVTAVVTTLTEKTFNEPHHFQGTQTMLDPFTLADTGLTARQVIAQQATTHGWPLLGIYISASGGGSIPHFAVHRSEFPVQSGPPDQRAERLQNDIQLAMDNIYKSSVTIDDPTDPDFGQTVDVRNFWVSVHVFNYRADGLYEAGVDYRIRVSNNEPPGNWWQN